jgi:hypothetical protein
VPRPKTPENFFLRGKGKESGRRRGEGFGFFFYAEQALSPADGWKKKNLGRMKIGRRDKPA